MDKLKTNAQLQEVLDEIMRPKPVAVYHTLLLNRGALHRHRRMKELTDITAHDIDPRFYNSAVQEQYLDIVVLMDYDKMLVLQNRKGPTGIFSVTDLPNLLPPYGSQPMSKPAYIYHRRGDHYYRQAEDGSVLHLLYIEDYHAIVNKISAREMLLANMQDQAYQPKECTEQEFNRILDRVKSELGI